MKIKRPLLIGCISALTLAPAFFELHAAPPVTDISQRAKPATIRILLAKEAEKALLEVKGRYHVYDPETGLEITSGILSKRAYLMDQESGLRWGENFPAIHRMRIVPGDSQTTILVNGLEHKGCLEIYCQEGRVNLINEIDIDHYLKSVLNQQFPDKNSLEFLDAIAIVARTHAHYLVGRNPGAIWHIDAKEINYLGQGATLQNVIVDRAVENTRHMILTYQEAPFAAAWTEDSAGKTAEYSSIFRKNTPSPKGVEVPLALRDREKHKWAFSIPKRQLAKIARLDEVAHVDTYVDKQSNKVYALKVDSKNDSENIDFFALQKELGSHKLKSSDFTVSLKGDNVVFEGYGSGPGVGLCLYSAEIMARHGLRAPQILAAFFPNTTLENQRKPTVKN